MDDNDTSSLSTLGKRRRTNNDSTKDDINTSHQINDTNVQTYKQIPSEIFATNILTYLDYQSILSLSATCKHILYNIIPLITTLHINTSIQMNGLIVQRRRFRDNVKSINIYSLLVQRSEDDFDQDNDRIIKYYDIDTDTVMRFIPFISQFSNLQRVFVGGMVRGEVIHIPNRSLLWDDEGDVNRVQTLMDTISGAFRVGGVLPRDLQVRGLRCPYSGNYGEEDNDVRTCEVCERACQSLPIEQVVQFGNGGLVSDDIDCDFHRPRCSLTHVCLERSQIESIVESRPGGGALLRSNARFMFLLGRGSVYEIPSEDSDDLIVPNYQHPDGDTVCCDATDSGNSSSDESMSGPDDEQLPDSSDDEGSDESDDEDDSSSSSSSNEEDMANETHYEPPHGPSLYIVKYTEDEMEEMQRVLEYSGLNAARIPQEEVTRAMMQSFARDDKVPPSNQCYLSKESLVYLRDVIGLSMDEEVFSTPDVAVDYLIQLTQAVSDAPPIQADCIILLCNILKKLRDRKILHGEAVLMLSGCCMDQLVDSMCEGYTIVARQAAIMLLGEIAWKNTRNSHFKKRVVDAAIHSLVDTLSSNSSILVLETVRTIGKIAKDSIVYCRNKIFQADAVPPLLMLLESSKDVSMLVEVSNTLWMISERLSCFGYGKMMKCLKPLSEFLMTDKLSPVGDQIELWECTRSNICFTMYCICLHNRCAINTVIETGVLPHLMSIDEGKHILGLLVKYEKFWNYTAVVSIDLPKMIPFLSNSNNMIKTVASRAIYNAIFYAEKDYIPDIVTRLGCRLPIVILMLSNNTDSKLRRYDQEAGIMKTLVSGGCIRSLCDMISNSGDEKIIESSLQALQAILKPDGKQSYKIVHCEVNWIMECLNELDEKNKFGSLSGIIKFDIQSMLHGCKKEKNIVPIRSLGIVRAKRKPYGKKGDI